MTRLAEMKELCQMENDVAGVTTDRDRGRHDEAPCSAATGRGARRVVRTPTRYFVAGGGVARGAGFDVSGFGTGIPLAVINDSSKATVSGNGSRDA